MGDTVPRTRCTRSSAPGGPPPDLAALLAAGGVANTPGISTPPAPITMRAHAATDSACNVMTGTGMVDCGGSSSGHHHGKATPSDRLAKPGRYDRMVAPGDPSAVRGHSREGNIVTSTTGENSPHPRIASQIGA